LAADASVFVVGDALTLVLAIVPTMLDFLGTLSLANARTAARAFAIAVIPDCTTTEAPLHTYLAGNWFRD